MEKQTPYSLPQNWTWTALEEILRSLESGKRPKGGVRHIKEGIPSIGGEHLNSNGGFDFTKIKFVPHGFFNSMNKGIIEKKDVLVVKDGATTGKTSFVDNNFPFEEAAINEHVFILRPFSSVLSPKYLFYWMYSPYGQDCVKKNFKGSAQGGINTSFIKYSEFPLPPLNEQVRIVGRVEELFNRLDEGVRSLQAAQIQLEQYRQTTLKQAYTGKLTQKWRQENSSNKNLLTNEINIEQYRNLIPWDIPSEWIWASLGNYIESMQNGIYKPKKFYSNDGIACLRMYNIKNGKIVWKDIKRMILTEDEIKKFLLKPDDILINRVNSRELVGKSAVIPSNLEPSVYESKNIRVHINQDIVSSKFIQYWMHFFSSRYFNLNAQQVVGMASINQTQISNMPIPMTILKEQKIIVEIINNIDQYLDKIGQTSVKNSILTSHLKNSILKKAFEGRLVPQEPNDETAKLVLEKLKGMKINQRKII